MSRALLGVVAVGILAGGLLAACVPEPPDDGAPGGSVTYAAPDGGGPSCSLDDPCALADAVARAGAAGGEVRLLDGDYGDVELSDGGAQGALSSRVAVSPHEGADAVLGKLTLDVPGTTWRGLTITGGVYLDVGATGTRLDAVHVDGSGVFVHADGVRIRDAVIENGESVDGLQVAGASDLVVEGTIIRGFLQGDDSDVHSDCVQLFDTSGVVLRGNYFGNCDNAGVIFSPGQGHGISDVLVEANHIQGCLDDAGRCSGGTAFDLRGVTGIRDVVVRNNTILDGAVRVDPIDGIVFDRNIVGYAANCDLPMTNSIVASWNTGTCDRPDALGRDGNREGEVQVRDREGGDLRPVDLRDAAIDPSGGRPAETGFGGATLRDDEAGAGG